MEVPKPKSKTCRDLPLRCLTGRGVTVAEDTRATSAQNPRGKEVTVGIGSRNRLPTPIFLNNNASDAERPGN